MTYSHSPHGGAYRLPWNLQSTLRWQEGHGHDSREDAMNNGAPYLSPDQVYLMDFVMVECPTGNCTMIGAGADCLTKDNETVYMHIWPICMN